MRNIEIAVREKELSGFLDRSTTEARPVSAVKRVSSLTIGDTTLGQVVRG